ncbi:cobalamin-independent methionine synthase II family protein [Emticicia sp. BO119]|uniref:cobalamin-independent methionine synthase II family protein n=1 Tax=Emticicia sp. BO119 TaxID=2757768 RepID=UPI0015F069B9|nr:cobalamin-independent methionine synthase II family protein [Emticicia sp. BO119]MBA4849087.1 cobalamin-independent methionine synthase II family protein [Emticicia sp. BO119]
MQPIPIRTTVVGSYPFPGWLEFSSMNLDKFGAADIEEMIEDAVIAAIHDQTTAGLDVITDGEQTRLDFNLSFYGFIKGLEPNHSETRKFGPPAHDQRGKHSIIEPLTAPKGLGAVKEYQRLARLAPQGHTLKASVPGPYTLSGRMLPDGKIYKDRFEVTEGLLPFVKKELEDLVAAGCTEITVDEPSMSCYAYKEDTKRFVDIFNRTIGGIVGKARVSTHLCFGNFKGRPVGYRKLHPMLPDFLDMAVDEIHIEMANREFDEVELLAEFAQKMDVAVGIIDVKNYYCETVKDVMERIELCLKYVPAEKLAIAPDCGLSQTARWASRQKLKAMCDGAKAIREKLGIR